MALRDASVRARTASGDFRSIASLHCEHCVLGLRSPTVDDTAVPHFGQLTENCAHSIAILSGATRTSIVPGVAGSYTLVRPSKKGSHHKVLG